MNEMASLSRTNRRAALWTPKKVIDALADAYRVLSAIEGRVGHKQLKAHMPEPMVSWSDFWGQQIEEADKGKRAPVKVRRPLPSSQQIAHMETVLIGGRTPSGVILPPWLNGTVRGYPEQRRKLLLGSMARARGISDRKLCRRRGWTLSTFQRQRNRAAEIVAGQLNRANLPTW